MAVDLKSSHHEGKVLQPCMDFPCGSAGKESACNVGNRGLIPRLGRCPGEGNSYPLQYSGLENLVRVVSKSRTKLSNFQFHGSRPEMLSSQEKSFVTMYGGMCAC